MCMRVVVCLSWSVVVIYDCFVSVGLHVGEFRSSASKHQAVTLRPDRGDMILALACIGGGVRPLWTLIATCCTGHSSRLRVLHAVSYPPELNPPSWAVCAL